MIISFFISNVNDSHEDATPLGREEMTQDTEKYYALLKDAEQKLYLKCKTFTKLYCIIRLFQLKVMND